MVAAGRSCLRTFTLVTHLTMEMVEAGYFLMGPPYPLWAPPPPAPPPNPPADAGPRPGGAGVQPPPTSE